MKTRTGTPQKAAFSLTNTICNYVKGVYTIHDLQDAHFFFGCQRDHCFGNPGQWPTEATWCNTQLPKKYTEGDGVRMPFATVSPAAVDADFRSVVEQFMLMIEQADKEGRVTWGVHPLTAIRKLHPETDVFFEGHSHKASNWQEASDE